MAWTNPTTRATADLITASIWNTDIVNNLSYLCTSGLLSISGFGTHLLSAGGTGANALHVVNTTSGVGNFAYFRATGGTTIGQFMAFTQGYTTGSYDVQASVALTGDGAGGLSIAATHASGAIRFYAGNALRWGINAAGDLTFGASSHIADSSGTPALGHISGTAPSGLAGTDYAFQFTTGTGNTSITATFGHTFNSAPICTANAVNGTALAYTTTTTTIVFTTMPNATVIHVLCRGY